MGDENEDVDNETYLKEMETDRNWQIPREKLEITGETLGTEVFGIVQKGFYLRRDDSKLPVAVKTLRGWCFSSLCVTLPKSEIKSNYVLQSFYFIRTFSQVGQA